MKLGNFRIPQLRSYLNTNRSQEVLDVYQNGGRTAVVYMKKHIPPAFGYEKWIYTNESVRFLKKRGSQKLRFLIVFYVGENETKTVKFSGTYKNYYLKTCRTLKEVFTESFSGKEDYVIFLDENCHSLADDALWEMAELIEKDHLDFFYSDQDEWDNFAEKRINPFFKPDWSPDTLESFFYTGSLAAYRMDLCRDVRISCEGSFESCLYEFTKQFVRKCSHIGHIPEVLYHGKSPYRYIENKMEEKALIGSEEMISVIIPSMDHFGILRQCVESLRKTEKYDKGRGLQCEIIVVDNGSSDDNRVKIEQLAKQYGFSYIYKHMPFNFSRMCNLGAHAASGDYLLFLNDDIEAREPGWIMKMYELASREYVGAVGAKLYYPGGKRIQHIGVVNLDIGPGHYFLEQEDEGDLYFGRNIYDYNCLAVTAACMMINRKKFEQVGGFDESFPVSYNDIDLCFSLYEQGYYNVVCNRTSLYHHESLSRGYDSDNKEKEQRLLKERQRLYDKHSGLRQKDPFYNKNLSGWLGNFELNLDEYGKDEKDIMPLPDSKVERLWWDIRPEWLNPDLVLQIDYINQEQGHVSIRGWAYLKDRDNFNYIRRLVFLNEEDKSFCVGTRSRYRGYLKEQFPEVEGMEMLGFTCDFSSDKMRGKKYRIGMMAESKDGKEIYMIFTERWVEIAGRSMENEL